VLRTLSLLAALLAACTLSLGGGEAWEASPTLARLRALESYALMQRYFYVPARRSFNGTYPPIGRGYAQVWPYSQALSATLEVAQLPDGGAARSVLQRRISTLAPYRAPFRQLAYAPLYGGRGNAFYDDNAWIGIDLVEAAALLNDEADLDAAQKVLTWLESGWDAKARVCRGGVYWLMPGGKYWNRSPRARYRTAVSTANGALLAVLLYERTHRPRDLAWAEKAYAWTADCLGTGGGGLIADHIDAAGNVTTAIHSYNQGAMVATAVNLYRVTHRHAYLATAVRIADASLATFQNPLDSGEEASMLSIYYGDLLTLTPIARGAVIRRAVTSFADRAWLEERDPATGLFHFGHTLATLLDQSAMVQLYAELARAA
jgi:hypothetical protein